MRQFEFEPANTPLIIRVISATSGLLGKYGGFFVLAVTILIMVYEVVARYVFGRPTMWALEYAIYAQALFVTLSAAYVLREEGHVSIGLVLEQLTEVKRNWLVCATSILGAVYSGVLSVQLWNTASWSLRVGTASETMGIPLAPLQFALFGGLCLLGLQFLVRGFEHGRRAIGAKLARTHGAADHD